ncbi:MAG: NAD(P)H-binding protein [Bacteroidales bacterium]|nr:NAD(P)H-binding protein [Bacteroidales bacterium]
MKTKIAVTGALGYSGKHVANILFNNGLQVKTLTNSTQKPNPFGDKLEIVPLDFQNPDKLSESLKDCTILINTYWVRFNHKKFNHHEAVENTRILFEAAKKAGIKKIVHVSITNPDKNSKLEYFKGKGELEDYLINLGISYSIVRPAVLFGDNDILINNIAWTIRKLPIMGTFGPGLYKIQPIHVEDFANILVEEAENPENNIVNAIGPETFTYRGLIKTIMKIIGIKKPVICAPPWIGYLVGKKISKKQNDVTITFPEIRGLMKNLLYVDTPATGKTKLTDWAKESKNTLGMEYASELSRRK